MSYRKKHIKSKIHKIKPKHSILRRPVFWILFLFLIIILFAFYIFIFYSGLQVKNVIISGNEKAQSKDIEDFIFGNVDKIFLEAGNLKLTSKNIFLVNTDDLSKKVLKKFSIIKKLKIDKKLPQTLLLGVEERKPLGIFCNNFLAGPKGYPEAEKEECFLIDENGVIFEPIFQAPKNVTVVRQALGEKNVFTGEEVIAKNIMSAISKIKNSLKDNFQINVEEALISNPFKINIKTNENWEIYFDLDSDINLQIAKMNLILKKEISAENRKNLQYIDLRFKDRAYYK